MSAAASTEPPAVDDTLRAAARGELPPWARLSAGRRAHLGRVVALLDDWAERLDLPEAERVRWRAAGWLHDALRETDPEELRPEVPEDFRAVPGPLLHGPAAASRLRRGGMADEGVLDAIAFHTLGHPRLEPVGRAVYLADFLEPGRTFAPVLRSALLARMPGERDAVLVRVVAARVRHLLEVGRRIRPETLAFWNSLVR